MSGIYETFISSFGAGGGVVFPDSAEESTGKFYAALVNSDYVMSPEHKNYEDIKPFLTGEAIIKESDVRFDMMYQLNKSNFDVKIFKENTKKGFGVKIGKNPSWRTTVSEETGTSHIGNVVIYYNGDTAGDPLDFDSSKTQLIACYTLDYTSGRTSDISIDWNEDTLFTFGVASTK